MFDREDIELALLGVGEGMGFSEAGALVGASGRSVRRWAAQGPPHARGKMGPERARRTRGSAPAVRKEPGLPKLNGEEMTEAEVENILLRAVLADLKAGGWDPASISNAKKAEFGERLRAATGLPLRRIIGFLRISKSSYEYHRARIGRPERRPGLRARVKELFYEGDRNWGYRTVWAKLRAEGVRVSEKVVRRIMREEGLRVVYARRRRRGWSSYEGEVSKAPDNLVNRDFSADAPDRLWLTDITEFRLPDAGKAYLSVVVDCFDGRPAAWRVGRRPDAELANATLLRAVSRMGRGAAPVVHSDRGAHYRWPGWIEICRRHGLTRSMSRKACSPDNAACEGFFGRLKNEFFYHRDWSGVSFEGFRARLDSYLEYYCERRIKRSLGWLSPNQYRRMSGYAA